MDIRANIREYFDKAYEGEPAMVPRKHDRNIVIISVSLHKDHSVMFVSQSN